jgi:hypothetical protein
LAQASTPPPLPSAAPPPKEEPKPPERPQRKDWHEDDDIARDNGDKPRRQKDYYEPHRGTMILVFGILSLVVFPIVFGPIAWIMGNNDLAAIRAGRMDPEGEGLTNAGRVCGIIGTILAILQVLIFVAIACMCITGGIAGTAHPKRF